MIIVSYEQKVNLSYLFEGYKWNYISDSILEGQMGEVLADNETDPQFAVLSLPKLKMLILGGDAGSPLARTYLESLPFLSMIMCSTQELEAEVQEVLAGKIIHLDRYAFTSENLDLDHLRGLVSNFHEGYRLQKIDLQLAEKIANDKHLFDEGHLINFSSPQDFITRGFGYCILQGDEIVSIATTFAVCTKGIEIQINTNEKHQGRGLGIVIAAQLIVHALEKGIDPNWDAATEISQGLAKKLGYTDQGTYLMLMYIKFRPLMWLRKGLRKLFGRDKNDPEDEN